MHTQLLKPSDSAAITLANLSVTQLVCVHDHTFTLDGITTNHLRLSLVLPHHSCLSQYLFDHVGQVKLLILPHHSCHFVCHYQYPPLHHLFHFQKVDSLGMHPCFLQMKGVDLAAEVVPEDCKILKRCDRVDLVALEAVEER